MHHRFIHTFISRQKAIPYTVITTIVENYIKCQYAIQQSAFVCILKGLTKTATERICKHKWLQSTCPHTNRWPLWNDPTGEFDLLLKNYPSTYTIVNSPLHQWEFISAAGYTGKGLSFHVKIFYKYFFWRMSKGH